MMTVLFSFSNWNWLVVIHGFSFVLIAVVCFFCPTDCQNLFGIIYRCPQEMKEKLLMFRLVGDEINKQEWLQKLTTGLANTACTADTVCTVFTPLTVTARNTILIRHFWNEKGTGAETRLAIDSGIVTGDAPVSYWSLRSNDGRQRERGLKSECAFLRSL